MVLGNVVNPGQDLQVGGRIRLRPDGGWSITTFVLRPSALRELPRGVRDAKTQNGEDTTSTHHINRSD